MRLTEPVHEVYLKRAAEVESLAAKIAHEADRAAMLKIASEWRRLSEESAKRLGVTLASPAPNVREG